MYLEEREYLSIAKNLMVGEVTKVIHKGCGQRPSLHIANEADRWWAYCHKCRRPGSTPKQLQRIKVKVPEKTGWIPESLQPAADFIPELLHNSNLPGWVWEYITLLSYSPDTKRLYLPDSTSSLWGYDATGVATARLYSPYKRPVANYGGISTGEVFVTSSISRYLRCVRDRVPAYLVGGASGYDTVVGFASTVSGRMLLVIDRKANFHPQFIRNLKQFGAKLNGS